MHIMFLNQIQLLTITPEKFSESSIPMCNYIYGKVPKIELQIAKRKRKWEKWYNVKAFKLNQHFDNIGTNCSQINGAFSGSNQTLKCLFQVTFQKNRKNIKRSTHLLCIFFLFQLMKAYLMHELLHNLLSKYQTYIEKQN